MEYLKNKRERAREYEPIEWWVVPFALLALLLTGLQ